MTADFADLVAARKAEKREEKQRQAAAARGPRIAAVRPGAAGASTFGLAALRNEVDGFRSLPDGRNEALNTAAFNLGQLVGGGELPEELVRDSLTEAADSCGYTEKHGGASHTEGVIRSGMEAGKREPRSAPPLPPRPVMRAVSFIPTSTPDAGEEDEGEPAPAGDDILAQADAVFWDARPELAHIRDTARALMAAPWATLGVVLVRVLGAVPPSYVLPALVGRPASLNLYVALVAPSGGGKGTAEGAAEAAVDMGGVTTLTVGSGEGIAHSYARREKGEGGESFIIMHTDSVVFSVPEVDTLTALKGRQSSTLMQELRKAWSGERLGFAYVDETKRLPLEPHSYRLGLILGMQPGRGAALLSEEAVAGGDPQRFLWMPAVDPNAPDEEPPAPEPLSWQLPPWPQDVPFTAGRHALAVCATATDTIRTERRKRLRGQAAALDGHALLARLKVAAALGLLAGHPRVSEDDWELAGVVMAVSDHTREGVSAAMAADAAERNRRRGLADADRAVVTEERVAEAGVVRACQAILRKLAAAAGEAVKGSDLRRGIRAADRAHFDEAVERLVGTGHLAVEQVEYRGQAGHRYRLAEGAR